MEIHHACMASDHVVVAASSHSASAPGPTHLVGHAQKALSDRVHDQAVPPFLSVVGGPCIGKFNCMLPSPFHSLPPSLPPLASTTLTDLASTHSRLYRSLHSGFRFSADDGRAGKPLLSMHPPPFPLPPFPSSPSPHAFSSSFSIVVLLPFIMIGNGYWYAPLCASSFPILPSSLYCASAFQITPPPSLPPSFPPSLPST